MKKGKLQSAQKLNGKTLIALFKRANLGLFLLKSRLNFDLMAYLNPLHDELQIVYANLRV